MPPGREVHPVVVIDQLSPVLTEHGGCRAGAKLVVQQLGAKLCAPRIQLVLTGKPGPVQHRQALVDHGQVHHYLQRLQCFHNSHQICKALCMKGLCFTATLLTPSKPCGGHPYSPLERPVQTLRR